MSVMGPILKIVTIDLLFATLYQVQIKVMSNESDIKPIFHHTYFYTNWTNIMPPLGLWCPYVFFIGPIIFLARL